MTDRRILYAEFRGYRRVMPGASHWWFPEGSAPPKGSTIGYDGLPDPENNDTDCMALVRALNDAGYGISIIFMPSHAEIEVIRVGGNETSTWTQDVGDWDGHNYRYGVCDLAEPIVAAALEQQEKA